MPHTPGPWRVWAKGYRESPPISFNVETSGGLIREWLARDIANEADAQLMAAAPELLAALKAIVEHYGDPLKLARAAIAKAEGRD